MKKERPIIIQNIEKLDMIQENRLLKEENEKLKVFAEQATKLLKLYDEIDDWEYQLFLDSFTMCAAKKFDRKLEREEIIQFRWDLKDFIDNRMTID